MRTGLSSWILAIVKALDEAGCQPEKLMDRIGMNADRIGDFNYRYSQEQVTSLWIAAVRETGDPDFGLKVACHIRPSTFHVVGYAMSCSATLKRAAERFAHSARLISDSARVSFSEEQGNYRLSMDLSTGGRKPIYHTLVTMLAGFFMLCEWIAGEQITPVEITFRHRKPTDDSAYREVFRCPVRYSQPTNSILFPVEVLERPVPSANEELAAMLDEMAARFLVARLSSRFSAKVRDALISQLPNGEPSRSKTAAMMALTERTLLRRLKDENTTFKEVLDHLRETMAYDYLRRGDLSIDDIAYLLGFSSGSTFSRAFMRWTGQRPGSWRENQFLTPQGAEAALSASSSA